MYLHCGIYIFNVEISFVVRSFGTEDRPVAKRIPPRNDVYEYIIFRGSDIRDLSVNRDITSQDEHQDPAIVSAVSPSSNLWF